MTTNHETISDKTTRHDEATGHDDTTSQTSRDQALDSALDSPVAPGQELSWQDALAQGRAGEALWHYLRHHPDDAISDTLTVLSDVQRFLRAKQPQRALSSWQHLQDPSPLLDFAKLEQQLHILKDTAEWLEQRQVDAAMEGLQAVDMPLLQAEAETQRGTAYIFQNQLELAQESFARAVAQDPKHYRAITNQGNLALEAGNVDEAIAAYEQALRINEDFANAHHNLGVAYRRKGEYGKSVAAIKRAQRAMRAQDTQEARSSLSSLGRSGGGKMVKWLVYGALGYGLYLFLQTQGIL